MPLLVEGRAVGLLGMGFYEPRKFSAEERAFVETFSKHCAQALSRAGHLEREDEAQRWFATTLRSIGDAVIATDPEGHVTFMNTVAERLTGWTDADARGRGLEEVFHIFSEQTRELVESPVTKVLREGKIVGLANHTVLRSKSGVEIPIDDSGAPIRDESGRIHGVVLVFRDATEEKREQRAARVPGEGRRGAGVVARLPYDPRRPWRGSPFPSSPTGAPSRSRSRGPRRRSRSRWLTSTPSKVEFARELGERYPPDPDAPTGVPKVIRTREVRALPRDPARRCSRRGAQDAEHLRIIEELQLESAMVVPLRARRAAPSAR